MKKKPAPINAFLGADAAFEGSLTFGGALRIDGQFKGEICDGGTLIIGESAVLRGNVHAKSVIVCGELHGNTLADERVEILSSARIFGDVQAPEIIMGAGAVFEGKCQTEGYGPQSVE